jgi:Putative transposase
VLGIFVREVFRSLRRRASDNGVPKGECASVTFVQRFGSAANLTPHFHAMVLDGVYACAGGEEPPRFYPLRAPDTKDVVAVAEQVAVRVAALLETRDDVAAPEEPAMADLYGASLAGTLAVGPHAGQKVTTAGKFQEESFENHGSRCAMVSGFSVHAGVGIRAEDRKGLERLLRYAARPPIAVDRLAQLPDGRLSYTLKTPWRNGATHVIFEPLEFLARLAVLVPAPRVNLIRFHGQLAPSAKWREAIVPNSTDDGDESDAGGCGDCRTGKKPPGRNYSWASLMARVFEIDVLKCSDCNGRLKILAAIHPPTNTQKILECMGLPIRPPPIARAVSEPTCEEF